MTLSAKQVNRLAVLSVPVLCVDTCTILDVLRDVTRDTVRPSDAGFGLQLLNAAETKTDLVVLMAQQVVAELASNITDVETDANKKLLKYQSEAERIHDVVSLFGATGVLGVQHFQGHVARARKVLDRWKAISKVVPVTKSIKSLAFSRVMSPRAPARKGKESMKDCVVFETYLETARRLRGAGFTMPIVFASSNTNEYQGHPEIAVDLAAVTMAYAPNFGAAKHLLGI